MSTLHDFKITEKWPPQHPERLQLYSYPTPNGKKIAIMLEEIGLPYEPHLVTLDDADVKSPEFLSLNPNNKIPAIIDPDGPNGQPLGLWESGAILMYLAEKSGQLGGSDTKRWEIITWLQWQMAGLGPMLGQLGFFVKLGGKDIEDPRPRQRYIDEARRLLSVLEGKLDGYEWAADQYSIADIAIAPWLDALNFYEAKDLVGWSDFPRVNDYLERFKARPAVQRGWNVPDPG
ncbi:glutathione S-transferase N-terminal domain-containing protein [Maribius pontilimi]|uniref:Glutathione S-transferase N-terminal domain-containing protein n=1 Tax=Palleronia pontilimi TaxID=1964209 RepID=A0A934ILH9_9RHOB|nr:glutathione S-transferase N-terminal domain-containing protein [Palleronia pontilimi]MBJ3764219.1 glutathione S-transferase N-terminal domain-containing protein [Palleronia pontilimi]